MLLTCRTFNRAWRIHFVRQLYSEATVGVVRYVPTGVNGCSWYHIVLYNCAHSSRFGIINDESGTGLSLQFGVLSSICQRWMMFLHSYKMLMNNWKNMATQLKLQLRYDLSRNYHCVLCLMCNFWTYCPRIVFLILYTVWTTFCFFQVLRSSLFNATIHVTDTKGSFKEKSCYL